MLRGRLFDVVSGGKQIGDEGVGLAFAVFAGDGAKDGCGVEAGKDGRKRFAVLDVAVGFRDFE